MKEGHRTLLEITTNDDENEELKYRTQKHEFETISKSLKTKMNFIRKKLKSLKEKAFSNNSEVLIRGASTMERSTPSVVVPSFGIIISSSTALLKSIAILITKEYISKSVIRVSNLKGWINVINLL